MNTVIESIYSGKSIIIPLADVQHIEKSNPRGLVVVTKHTRWDAETDTWANNIWIDASEAPGFIQAWCAYRSELEAETLANLEPVGHPAFVRRRSDDDEPFDCPDPITCQFPRCNCNAPIAGHRDIASK